MTLYTVLTYLKNITYNSHEPHSSHIWVFSHIFIPESNEKISQNMLSVSWMDSYSIHISRMLSRYACIYNNKPFHSISGDKRPDWIPEGQLKSQNKYTGTVQLCKHTQKQKVWVMTQHPNKIFSSLNKILIHNNNNNKQWSQRKN
jgi:hypothetical protein